MTDEQLTVLTGSLEQTEEEEEMLEDVHDFCLQLPEPQCFCGSCRLRYLYRTEFLPQMSPTLGKKKLGVNYISMLKASQDWGAHFKGNLCVSLVAAKGLGGSERAAWTWARTKRRAYKGPEPLKVSLPSEVLIIFYLRVEGV